MATMMLVNVYQSVTLINVDQVIEISPVSTGGCVIHLNADGTRGDGKPSHHIVSCTDDFKIITERLRLAGVTFIL